MPTDTIVTVAAPSLEAKRDEAKAFLGSNWVRHPDYKTNPRHSNNQDIYVPARKQFLQFIADASRRDRESNPAFKRAESLRNTVATN